MKQLKILFAEDVINDMELAEWELKKAGIDFISVRVETKEDYITQITKFNPDVVISDFAMPSFDGMTALRIANELNPELPVIIHTGSINEETAVNCIKAGAADYILKDKLLRLPHAVMESYQKALINKENIAANEALQASEEKYKALFNSMAQGVLYLNNTGNITMVNPAAIQILDLSDVSNLHIGDIVANWTIKSEDGTVISIDKYVDSDAFISGKKIGNVVVSAFNKRLSIEKWLSINAIPQYKKNDNLPFQVFITFEDITARKLVEIELAKSESSYRFLFDSNPHPMWVFDHESLLIKNVNQSAINKYGYTKEQFQSSHIGMLWEASSSAAVTSFLRNSIVLENSGPWTHFTKNGTALFVEISSHDIVFENKLSRIMVAYDLSERIIAENALKDSERKYRNLFENSPIGIYTSLLDGTITFANDALVRLLKYDSPAELYNTSFDQIYVSLTDRETLIRELKEDGFVKNYELTIKTKHGNSRNLLLSALLECNQITGMMMDITERKESELELLAAKKKAEESDKLKTAFLANLSHEVRTPMNAIIGFSDLLVDLDKDDDTMKMYINTIRDNSIQLLGIITDIIEISKIETEKVVTHISEFKLEPLKSNLEELFQMKVQKKDLKLILNGLDTSVILTTDEQKINKIIFNLVDNAIKFTDKGEISVSFDFEPDSLLVSVKDSGVGISEGHDELIFERFRQSDLGYDRKHGGTGLGLSIAKAYVEALNGSIWFIRNNDGGTTFNFRVPVKWRSTIMKELNGSIPDFSKNTFLIAEDDNINFIFITSLLAPTKANIIYASNGIEAIEQFKSNPHIDLILMDIKMPLMNGFEATRIIRENDKSVPIIATTAYAMSGDKEKCIESGCNGYISKPIKRTELLKSISGFLQ